MIIFSQSPAIGDSVIVYSFGERVKRYGTGRVIGLFTHNGEIFAIVTDIIASGSVFCCQVKTVLRVLNGKSVEGLASESSMHTEDALAYIADVYRVFAQKLVSSGVS